jgi:hypothetical protein
VKALVRRHPRLARLLPPASLAVALAAVPAATVVAYEVDDNWCDRDALLFDIDMKSFTGRGFAEVPVDRHHRTAMTWWSDAQATLRYRYNTISTDHGTDDPGIVYAACLSEDGDLDGILGYTDRDYGWCPSCDFFGLNIDEWRTVIRSDHDRERCGDASGWALDIAGVRAGRTPLFVAMAHEYGHAFGLDHTNADPTSLLFEFVGTGARLSADDIAGLRKGVGEGLDERDIYTTTATSTGGGWLSWGNLTNRLNARAVGMPQIAGNPNWRFRPLPVDFDYAMGWISDDDDRIEVAVANDDPNDKLILGTVHTTGERSQHRIGVAVGWQNAIGVAWVSRGEKRTLNFMVSNNQGVDWKKTEMPLQQAMGGVDLAFDWVKFRWVMTWVTLGPAENLAFRVVTMVSNDTAGTSWPTGAANYGDTISQANLAPAITCARMDHEACLMNYRSFATPDIREIRQQVFVIDEKSGNRLNSVPTQAITGDYAYSDLGIERMDGTKRESQGYVETYVWPTTGDDYMTYRVKYDANGPDTAAYVYPRRKADLNPLMHSRSGFDLAFNYRTERLRFVWKWN